MKKIIVLKDFFNKRMLKRLYYALAIITIIIITLSLTLFLYLKSLGPPPLTVSESTIFYADDGTIIGEVNGGQKRYSVTLDEISPYLIDATIAIEDRRFFRHRGVDLKRIGGAIIADLKARAKVQGASTITQQYARNLFLEHEKSWRRKLTELLLALRLEMHYSKKEILEGYLNTINYGHGAYGIESASLYYFNKHASDLSLAEATMLAGIPKGPASFSPLISNEKATNRQKLIIKAMEENQFINNEVTKQTIAEPLEYFGKHKIKRGEFAAYFQDAVLANLKTEHGIDEETLAYNGLHIHTTLNINEQQLAEQIINELLPEQSEIEVGFVAMDQNDGHVTALVGGRDYNKSQFNRATQASRQPGSTFKPLLYYAALENGFTPTTKLRSEETTFFLDNDDTQYKPANFNNLYANDEITLMQALALSDNIFAVKTHLLLGTDLLPKTARKFGITTKLEEVPSLSLGTSGVRPIEMANAYSLFANGGKKVTPTFITKIEDRNGNVIFESKKDEIQILNEQIAFVMTDMMTGMFDESLNGHTAVTGQSMVKDITRYYAGKSGTTNTDSWMIGFSPQLTTVVWTGYDKNKKLTSSADKSFAKNIWLQFMEQSHQQLPLEKFKIPPKVTSLHIDPSTGLIATEFCPTARLTYFVAKKEPVEYCQEHGHNDKNDDGLQREDDSKKIPWYKWLFRWLQ